MACASSSAVEVAGEAQRDDELALGDVQRAGAERVERPVARDHERAPQIAAHEQRVTRHVHDVELLASPFRGSCIDKPAEEREALGGHLGRAGEMPFVAFRGRECVERAGFEEGVAAAAGGFDGGLRRRAPSRSSPVPR